MKYFLPILLLFCAFLSTVFASDGTLWNALNQPQKEILLSGKPLMVEEEVANNPWPRFIIYHLAKSSPVQAAAVFWDCELDPKYVPNCLSVSIIGCPKPWIHDGKYTLNMPLLLPNEVYVTRNEVRSTSPESYEFSWKVLQSRYIKGCNGALHIESHGTQGNQTLLCYSNLVMPGGQIAYLLRTNAGNQVRNSVVALVHQIENEIENQPDLMRKQIEALEHSLQERNQTAPVPHG